MIGSVRKLRFRVPVGRRVSSKGHQTTVCSTRQCPPKRAKSGERGDAGTPSYVYIWGSSTPPR
jgi:hypothetical protein